MACREKCGQQEPRSWQQEPMGAEPMGAEPWARQSSGRGRAVGEAEQSRQKADAEGAQVGAAGSPPSPRVGGQEGQGALAEGARARRAASDRWRVARRARGGRPRHTRPVVVWEWIEGEACWPRRWGRRLVDGLTVNVRVAKGAATHTGERAARRYVAPRHLRGVKCRFPRLAVCSKAVHARVARAAAVAAVGLVRDDLAVWRVVVLVELSRGVIVRVVLVIGRACSLPALPPSACRQLPTKKPSERCLREGSCGTDRTCRAFHINLEEYLGRFPRR